PRLAPFFILPGAAPRHEGLACQFFSWQSRSARRRRMARRFFLSAYQPIIYYPRIAGADPCHLAPLPTAKHRAREAPAAALPSEWPAVVLAVSYKRWEGAGRGRRTGPRPAHASFRLDLKLGGLLHHAGGVEQGDDAVVL